MLLSKSSDGLFCLLLRDSTPFGCRTVVCKQSPVVRQMEEDSQNSGKFNSNKTKDKPGDEVEAGKGKWTGNGRPSKANTSSALQELSLRQRRQSTYPYNRAVHPFLCRLDETAAFTVTAPNALIAAGFASMGMGLFTLFRPTPVLLFYLASHLKSRNLLLNISKDLVLATTLSWEAVLMFVLLVLGFVLTFSVRIKKRAVLLMHPWGLMLLYFDVVVWLTMTLCFHLQLLSMGPLNSFFLQIQFPLVYFVIIYIDSIVFCLLHYIYATYFIAAELSVIERCY